jgi:hypothetical protein
MMADVEVVISDQTKAISQAGFGLPLVFDPTSNVPYTEVTATNEIPTEAGEVADGMIGRMLSQEPAPGKVAVYGVDLVTAGTTLEDELNKMMVEHNDFYFLLLASRVQTDIEAVAEWAGANQKLFIAQNDITVAAADVVAMAANISSSRTGIFAYQGDKDPYLDAAIVGRIAPLQPGAVTWKFKELNGVPVSQYLNADVSALHAGNVNTYIKEMGVLQTSEGKATNGSYLDIQRSKDWLKARIQESIFFLLHNAEKIPYDDSGIAQVVSKLKSVLKLAVDRGIIAKDVDGNGMWSISAPRRVDIPTNTIANRILPDINFTATIAGAVHNVKVNGVLKV